jgi:hypothetical protein
MTLRGVTSAMFVRRSPLAIRSRRTRSDTTIYLLTANFSFAADDHGLSRFSSAEEAEPRDDVVTWIGPMASPPPLQLGR